MTVATIRTFQRSQAQQASSSSYSTSNKKASSIYHTFEELIRHGDAPELQNFLTRQPDLHGYGMKLLDVAMDNIGSATPAILKALLQRVRASEQHIKTAISFCGDMAVLQALLDSKPVSDIETSHSFLICKAASIADKQKQQEAAKLLLNSSIFSGVPLQKQSALLQQDGTSDILLRDALISRNWELAELLVRYGAACKQPADSAVCWKAVQNMTHSRDITRAVQLACKTTVECAQKDSAFGNLLQRAAQVADQQMLSFLVKNGADPSSRLDSLLQTCMRVYDNAARRNMLVLLLNSKVALSSKQSSDLLQAAIHQIDFTVVEKLIARTPALDLSNNQTPFLCQAAQTILDTQQLNHMLQLLLRAKADIGAHDSHGKMVLDYCIPNSSSHTLITEAISNRTPAPKPAFKFRANATHSAPQQAGRHKRQMTADHVYVVRTGAHLALRGRQAATSQTAQAALHKPAQPHQPQAPARQSSLDQQLPGNALASHDQAKAVNYVNFTRQEKQAIYHEEHAIYKERIKPLKQLTTQQWRAVQWAGDEAQYLQLIEDYQGQMQQEIDDREARIMDRMNPKNHLQYDLHVLQPKYAVHKLAGIVEWLAASPFKMGLSARFITGHGKYHKGYSELREQVHDYCIRNKIITFPINGNIGAFDIHFPNYKRPGA